MNYFSINRNRYYWNVLLIPYHQCCRCNTASIRIVIFTITSWNSVTILRNCTVTISLSRMLEEKMFQLFARGCVSYAEACKIFPHRAFNPTSSHLWFCRNPCVPQLNSSSDVCRVFQCAKAVLWENCTDVFSRGSGSKFTSGPLKDWGESARAL